MYKSFVVFVHFKFLHLVKLFILFFYYNFIFCFFLPLLLKKKTLETQSTWIFHQRRFGESTPSLSRIYIDLSSLPILLADFLFILKLSFFSSSGLVCWYILFYFSRLWIYIYNIYIYLFYLYYPLRKEFVYVSCKKDRPRTRTVIDDPGFKSVSSRI